MNYIIKCFCAAFWFPAAVENEGVFEPALPITPIKHEGVTDNGPGCQVQSSAHHRTL